MAFLPTEEQQAKIDYVLKLSPEERERVKLFMLVDTRDTLFTHMEAEEGKLDELYCYLFGCEEKHQGGVKSAIESFIATEKRLNTWLDGACFVLKTVLPWAIGLAVGIGALGKYAGAW